jgi:hypothetical protein
VPALKDNFDIGKQQHDDRLDGVKIKATAAKELWKFGTQFLFPNKTQIVNTFHKPVSLFIGPFKLSQ